MGEFCNGVDLPLRGSVTNGATKYFFLLARFSIFALLKQAFIPEFVDG